MTRLWQASVAMVLGLATLSPALAQQGAPQQGAAQQGAAQQGIAQPLGPAQLGALQQGAAQQGGNGAQPGIVRPQNNIRPGANNNQGVQRHFKNVEQAADILNQQQAAAQVNPNAGVNPAQGVNALPGQGRVPNPPNNLGNNLQGQPFINPDNLLDEFGAPLGQGQNQIAQQNQGLLDRARMLRQQRQQSQQNGSNNSGEMSGGFAGGGFIGGGLTGAATIEESILTGQARAIQASGEYNRNSGEAAISLETAKAIVLDNARASLKTYFELKEMNAQYQAKRNGGPLSKEKLDEWNRQDQPECLTRAEYNVDSGTIRWPALLQVDAFADHRLALEELFARRTASEFGPKSDFYRHVSSSTQVLKDRLKDHLQRNEKFFTDEEYVVSQNFLSSLALELRLAPALDGLVAN